MSRPKIIAGNWKMNLTAVEAEELSNGIVQGQDDFGNTKVILCPPFTSVERVKNIIADSPVFLGAQNMYWQDSGAFTGEISPVMLTALGVDYVILGHSERRQFFCESDDDVAKKTKAAILHGLNPIICVGETLEQREDNQTEDVIYRQLSTAVSLLDNNDAGKIVVAYEPVWAIGTGVNADPKEANEVAGQIRNILNGKFNGVADEVVIQYGGSVSSNNFEQFITQEEIDGALVGGASLKSYEFLSIIKIASGKNV